MRSAQAERIAAPAMLVLCIVDAVTTLDLLEATLTRLPGVRVIGALQGRLGLDLARAHHPALILLELELPDLPGIAVLQQLRADPRTLGIPVFTLGSPQSAPYTAGLLVAGVGTHLLLPLDVERLLARARAVLGYG